MTQMLNAREEKIVQRTLAEGWRAYQAGCMPDEICREIPPEIWQQMQAAAEAEDAALARMDEGGGSSSEQVDTDCQFHTGVVQNLTIDRAKTYPASAEAFAPARACSRPSGAKVGPARVALEGGSISHPAPQTTAAEAVTGGPGSFAPAAQDHGISHQAPEMGCEKVVASQEAGEAEVAVEAQLVPSDACLTIGEPGSEASVVPPRQVRRGRPLAIDERCKCRVISLMGYGLSLRQAAARIGVHHATLLRTMERDEHFAQEVVAARHDAITQPLLCVIRASRTNWRAAAWLAKHLQERFYRLEASPEERVLAERQAAANANQR